MKLRWMSVVLLLLASPAAPADAPYSGLGKSSVSPETIARFAPPPLAPEVSRRIQSMLDVRAPGMGEPSPDGTKLYFTWRVTGVTQIWRLDGPNQFPVQLTGGEDATAIEDVTPDGATLIVQRDHGGEENPGLYTMPASGGPLTPIQHVPGVQSEFDALSPDGRWVYFHSNDQKKDAYAIYRWDLVEHRRETVIDAPGLWSVADVQPDGHLLVAKATGPISSEYSEWDPATKTLSPRFGQGESVEYTAQYGAHTGELLVLTNKLGDFRRLYAWRAGTLTPVTPPLHADVSHFGIDAARKHVLYTVNQDGYTKLFALDAATLQPVALPSLPAADHVSFGTLTRDGRFATIGVETATAPRSAYVLDWGSGTLTSWVRPSAPEVDTRRFAAAHLEYAPARDGARIPLFVRRPERAGSGPAPVVVVFHGGPESQAVPGFSAFAQLFVDAGFVFVEPNVRGSDGYGKAYLNADNGPKRLQVITDIEDVARYVRKAYAVNGQAPKVGVFGGSYGGYSALMAMTRFAGDYDAGVSIVGISNLVTFLNNTAPYRRILRIPEYGDPVKDHDALVKLSPITYIDRLRAPLLVMSGANDPRVPVGEGVQIHEAAKQRNVPTELIVFANQGHGATTRDDQVLEYGHALRWFETYLKSPAGPATAGASGAAAK